MIQLLTFLRGNAPWLAAGFLLTFTSSFGQTFFISVFSGEIRSSFGLSHGEWGGIYSLGTLASAMVMVFAGGLVDRFRVRHIGAVILLVLAFATFAMAHATNVWALIIIIFFLRLMGQGMMGHTAMVAMARWFVASRGRAISVAGLGVATGEALLPIAFTALLGVFDWRTLWVTAGVLLLLLTPILFTLLHLERTPKSFATNTPTMGMNGRGWTRREALGHWLFWLMIPAILGTSAWITAFFFNQVNFAEAKGWSHGALVSLFPLYTTTSIVFMLASGWAVDHFGVARLVPPYLLPMAAGFGVLGLTTSFAATALGIVLIGASAGVNSTLGAAFWAEFYGTRHLGKIRAMTGAVMVLGSAIGPGISGVLIDLGITFPHQSIGIGVYFVVAGALASYGALRGQKLLGTPAVALLRGDGPIVQRWP